MRYESQSGYPANAPIQTGVPVRSNMPGPGLRALRLKLARSARSEFGRTLPGQLIDRAMRDAESLAGLTLLPEFFLPALAEEKIAETVRWHRHQQEVQERATISLAA